MRLLLGLAISLIAGSAQEHQGVPSAPVGQGGQFTLGMQVDEVSLRVSATDSAGRNVEDLELVDLRLRDDGRRPERILDFEHRRDAPVRAGLLIDTSRSMLWALPRERRLGTELVAEAAAAEAER